MKYFTLASRSQASDTDVRAVVEESRAQRFRVRALIAIGWLLLVGGISKLMQWYSEPVALPDYPQAERSWR